MNVSIAASAGASSSEQIDALNRLALAALQRAQPDQALDCLNQALALSPEDTQSLYHRGNALLALRRYNEANDSYARALARVPTFAPALDNHGTTLHRLGRLEEALQSYLAALAHRPDYPSTLNNCANVLRDLGRYDEAVAYCDQALRLRPRYAGAWTNRGNALLRSGRPDEAIANFDRALSIDERFALAWQSKGVALHDYRADAVGAIPCLLRALELGAESGVALDSAAGSLLLARRNCADWTDDAALGAQIVRAVQAGERMATPFILLSVSSDPAVQLVCTRTHCAAEAPACAIALAPKHPYGHERLRIGYLSGDLREHAVAYLIAGLLERHDRSHFEIFALSLRPAEDSPYGARLSAAVEHFIDLSSCNDREAAERIRALEIDILVDLVGYTQGFRGTLLSRRPAPLQVNYLGYPGTLGAPYIDYLIADEYLIPEVARPHYAEQVLYLPACFQANDDRRVHPEPTPRADLGLPEQALVLCCFNNSYKLNPAFFDVWMRLLAARSDAVLWLVSGPPIVEQNLRREAAARGIDPARLHFAPRLPYEQHLARLPAADLFLDTLPFNGGTTVSDALWMGVPVLSCSGAAFASRMGGSLLTSVGLPELIARDLPDYEQRALDLLEQPQQLGAVRTRLRQVRTTSPLFDTARFARHFEVALTAIHKRFEHGLPPSAVHVRASRPL